MDQQEVERQEPESESKAKVMRSVRLAPEVDAKLVKLTQALGTTISAYLNVEMGKAINRDYLAFQVAERQQASLEGFMQAVFSAVQQEAHGGADDSKDSE